MYIEKEKHRHVKSKTHCEERIKLMNTCTLISYKKKQMLKLQTKYMLYGLNTVFYL